MVIRIHRGETVDGALNYNASKESREVADILMKNMMEYDETPSQMRSHFMSRLKRCRGGVKNPVFTVSINPAPEDLEKLTDGDLRDIAEHYMSQMGYGDQPYIVYRHRDIERTHLHVVSVRVDDSGKCVDSRNERYRSSRVRREIEMRWGLEKAQDRSRDKRKAAAEAIRSERDKALYKEQALSRGEKDLRSAMRRALRAAEHYRYTSLREYNAVLRHYNMEATEIEVQGRKGIVYYNTDEDGRRVCAGVKGSAISREFSHRAFEERVKANAEPGEERTKRRRQAADRITRLTERLLKKGVTEKELTASLEANGIRIIKSVSADGRVFGLTFADMESGEMMKASEVSRELTASKVYARLRSESEGRRMTSEERRAVFRTARQKVRERTEREKVSEAYAKEDTDRLRGDIIGECERMFPEASLSEIMSLTEKAVTRIREEGIEEGSKERAEFGRTLKALASYATDDTDRGVLFALAGIDTDGSTARMRANPTAVEDVTGYSVRPAQGTEPLEKAEIDILKAAAQGRLKDIPFKGWEPWHRAFSHLKETDRAEAERLMTRAEAEACIKEGDSAAEATNALLERGFVIVPVMRTKDRVERYEIRHSDRRDAPGVTAPEWLSEKLDRTSYATTMYRDAERIVYGADGRVRWQYRTEVAVSGAMRIRDEKRRGERISAIADSVRRFNREAGDMIEREFLGGASARDITERLEAMTRHAERSRAVGRGAGVRR